MGSARFSPDGKQVAFALAKANPDDEQGWIALGASSGGTAKAILTGEPGSYYTIAGWLDDQTLLVQSNPVSCSTCASAVYTLSTDGSNVNKVAEGYLLVVVDNR
jgi:tricorn protease-like protein